MATPPLWQLGVAAVALLGIGLVHGASDLAIVARSARARFLLWYLAVAATCLIWWIVIPAVALPLFLLASAIHFALEDDAPTMGERVALGVGLIAIPATLHPVAYGKILLLAGAAARWAAPFAAAMAAGGLVALTVLAGHAFVRRQTVRIAGLAALLLLPPLPGFAAGFLLLHAGPQTDERRAMLGCSGHLAYLRRCAPVLAAAASLVLFTALAMRAADPSGVRGLFAAVAALAMPHLLVTPAFTRRPAMNRFSSPRHRIASEAAV